MIDNAKLSIIVGGYYHCTPKWNEVKETRGFDQVFAFFLPTGGEASIETPTGTYPVSAGHVYFIPSHHLIRQTCKREMWTYWITFVTESYYLYHRLFAIRSLHSWPIASVPWVEPVFKRFGELFDDLESDASRLRDEPPPGLDIQVEAVLLHLTGKLIEATESRFQWSDHAGLERLKPAIDFMDAHYLRNPSITEIASLLNLATGYFHRAFKRETGLTPFKYMENRRLELARKLLFDRRLNITEIARKAGYQDMSYFSRAFRQRYGRAPSALRYAP